MDKFFKKSIFLCKFVLIFSLSLSMGAFLAADSLEKKVENARQLLKEGQIEQAISLYTEALIDAPDSAILKYNIATAYYRQERYDKAQERYEEAILSTEDSTLLARIYYNLGNVYYRQGKLKESLVAYERSIELCKEIQKHQEQRAGEDPLPDKKAKQNHALVQKKILEALAKEKHKQDQHKETPPDPNHPVERLKKLIEEEFACYQKSQKHFPAFKQGRFLALLQEEVARLQSLQSEKKPKEWEELKQRFLRFEMMPLSVQEKIKTLVWETPLEQYQALNQEFENLKLKEQEPFSQEKQLLAQTQSELATRALLLAQDFLTQAAIKGATPPPPSEEKKQETSENTNPSEEDQTPSKNPLKRLGKKLGKKFQSVLSDPLKKAYQSLSQKLPASPLTSGTPSSTPLSPEDIQKYSSAGLLVEQAGGDLQKAVSSLTQQDLMTALEQQENSIQKLQEALLPFLNSIQKLEQLLREEITCATHTKQSLHTEEQLLFWKQLKRRIQDWKTLAHPLEGKPNPSAWEQLRESLKQHQDIQPLLENLHWTSPPQDYDEVSDLLQQMIQQGTLFFKQAQKELPTQQEKLTARSQELSQEFLNSARAMGSLPSQHPQVSPHPHPQGNPPPQVSPQQGQAELFVKASTLIQQASGELQQAATALKQPDFPLALKNQEQGIHALKEAYALFQQDQKDQKNDDKDQKDQDQKDDPKDQDQKDPKDQDQKDQKKEDQKDPKDQDQKEPKEDQKELSEEEVKRLLNRIQRQQEERNQERQKQASGSDDYVEKDW